MSTEQLEKVVKISILWLVISGLIILADYAKVTDPVLSAFDRVIIPLQKGMNNLDRSISSLASSFIHITELKNENVELKEQIVELQSKVNEIEKLKVENLFLRSISCVVEPKEDIYIVAEEISVDRDFKGVASLKINKGEKDGVFNGAIVLSKPGVLLGRINKVREGTSQVETITSFSSKIAVYIRTGSGDVRGVLTGERGGYLVVENVDWSKTVKQGDQVVTSGEDEYFPKGLLVGVVDHVESNPASSFQTVYLNLMFDPNNLKYVLVSIK